MLRDDKWLFQLFDDVWDTFFPDVPQENDVKIVWGRKAKRRLGSIKQGEKRRGEHPQTIITINSLFKDPYIPDYVVTATGTSGQLNGETNLRFDGSTLSITGDTNMTGSLTAASKSFDIPHPTKDGYRLRYGVLEGPEHGVYFRGKTTDKIINLPDYWTGLVDEDSITVHLTPIKGAITHFVVDVKNNQIEIDSYNGIVNTYFIVHAERKDIEKVLLEYKPVN